MSQNIGSICALLLALVVGCVAPQGNFIRPEDGQAKDRAHEKLDGDAIEIQVRSSSGIPGGPCGHTKWVLTRSGLCRGTLAQGSNTGMPSATVSLELQSPEAYRECAHLLRTTWFFWMRDRIPEHQFESGSTSIEVRHGRRHHVVIVVGAEAPSAGFTRISDFVSKLTERATKVEAEVKPSE